MRSTRESAAKPLGEPFALRCCQGLQCLNGFGEQRPFVDAGDDTPVGDRVDVGAQRPEFFSLASVTGADLIKEF